MNFHEYLEYKEGKLFWKISPKNQIKIGDEAGKVDSSTYKRFVFYGKRYLVHRVIFYMWYGFMPKYIDHINRNKLDNRIENLRVCTAKQNAQNRSSKRALPKNVYYRNGKYRVAIRLNGVLKTFGTYRSIEEADKVANSIRDQHHGEYAI